MKRRSALFWVSMAYLVATVAYNVWEQHDSFGWLDMADKAGVGINLTAKVLAIALLLFRRVEGVLFLALAFVVGLSGTLWDFYRFHNWETLSLMHKIGRIDGFVISLAITIYMAALAWRGGFFSAGRTTANSN